MSLSSKPIAALGYGELGFQIDFLLQDLNKRFSAVFDDAYLSEKGENVNAFASYKDRVQDFEFIVCLGYNNLQLKTQLTSYLKSKIALSGPVISKNAFVSSNAILEENVLIYPGVTVDKGCIIKKGVLINNGVIVSHDSIIHDSCYLSPGVIVSGNVEIGQNTFVGAGSIISNGVKIGANCRIGIGTVVTYDLADNTSVIGNPMRILAKTLNLK